SVVQVRRRVLDAAQWERLDRAVGAGHHRVHDAGFVETLDLEVMHRIVGVVRRGMTFGASGLVEKQRLSPQLRLCGLRRIDFPPAPKLGSSSWNSAMKCTWLPRSRMFTPFLVAVTGSPSKYAACCSNSVKSSTLFMARSEPNSRWMFTPRSEGVSIRCRNGCGRMSPTRWAAPLVWPLA